MRRIALTLIALLASTGAALAALPVGTKAPPIAAPAFQAGKQTQFNLAAALKKGPVVVYFFPAAFTPGCNFEANAFAQAMPEFQAAGATVVGLTAGNTDQLAAFSQEHCNGKFPVAADPGAKIAKTYDAALTGREMSSRTSFVIGQDGKVVLSFTDSMPKTHIEKTLAAVKALKK